MKRTYFAIALGILMAPVMLLGFLLYTARLYFEAGLEYGEDFKNWIEAGVDDFYETRRQKKEQTHV